MFAAMKTGSMATYTPPPQVPVVSAASVGSQPPMNDSRKAQLKVLGIPDGTDPVSLLVLLWAMLSLKAPHVINRRGEMY